MDRILDYGSRDGGSNPPRCTKIPSFGGDFFCLWRKAEMLLGAGVLVILDFQR
jgi:hypothetical protein